MLMLHLLHVITASHVCSCFEAVRRIASSFVFLFQGYSQQQHDHTDLEEREQPSARAAQIPLGLPMDLGIHMSDLLL